MTKQTAANNKLIAAVKRDMNSKVLKRFSTLINTEGETAAIAFMQTHSNRVVTRESILGNAADSVETDETETTCPECEALLACETHPEASFNFADRSPEADQGQIDAHLRLQQAMALLGDCSFCEGKTFGGTCIEDGDFEPEETEQIVLLRKAGLLK